MCICKSMWVLTRLSESRNVDQSEKRLCTEGDACNFTQHQMGQKNWEMRTFAKVK